jgi:hypothetical protein
MAGNRPLRPLRTGMILSFIWITVHHGHHLGKMDECGRQEKGGGWMNYAVVGFTKPTPDALKRRNTGNPGVGKSISQSVSRNATSTKVR